MLNIKEFNLDMEDALDEEASEGFCTKWKKRVSVQGQPKTIWIKASGFIWGGYEHESLGEVVASQVAADLQIRDVVQYKPCILNITEQNGRRRRTLGCYSYDFTQQDEEVVSILNLYNGLCYGTLDYDEIINDVCSDTGLEKSLFRDYIDRIILLDAIILNEDRRTGNLAVIKNTVTGKYRICPIFDNGASFGLARCGYSLDGIYSDIMVTGMNCQPFKSLYDEQMELTRYHTDKEGYKELISKQKLNINRTVAFVNALYEMIGYEYDERWTIDKKRQVQQLRQRIGKVDEPIIIAERNYIISQLKRRIEVVIGQKEVDYTK